MSRSYWRGLALTGLAMAVLVSGGALLDRLPARIEIAGGKVTLVLVSPARLSAPSLPPMTPSNEQLFPSLDAAHGVSFAAPILAVIAQRPADYQDTFDNPGSGWESVTRDLVASGWESGQTGYKDGEYFVVADPAFFPHGAEHVTCNGGSSRNLPKFTDFALQIDGRFVSGKSGTWQLQWRLWNDLNLAGAGGYALAVGTDRSVTLLRTDNRQTRELIGGYPTALRLGVDTNHLLLVAQGARYAVFLNGSLALSGTLPAVDEPPDGGSFRLAVCNSADVPLRVQWDNLRIWRLSP